MTAATGRADGSRTARWNDTPERVVLAPDVVLSLFGDGPKGESTQLFDAIAASLERGEEPRAYVSAVTVPLVYESVRTRRDPGRGAAVLEDLFRLVEVVPLTKTDYLEASRFIEFEWLDALQFVTCRVVGAKYLVTRRDYGRKRSPVKRRRALDVAPLFGRG